LRNIIESFSKESLFEELNKKLKKNIKQKIFSVPHSSASFITSCIFTTLKNTNHILCILSSNSEAESYYRETLSYLPKEKILFFPGVEAIPYEYAHYSPELKRDRIKAISSILNGNYSIIFASVSSVLQLLPEKSNLFDKSLKITKDDVIDPMKLTRDLVNLGYKRDEICEQYGHFSQKGGIIDVFTPFMEEPIRLDFFGDTLESIKFFDPNTQKSLKEINEVVILPADEFILNSFEKEEYLLKLDSYDKSLKRPHTDSSALNLLEELNALVHNPSGLFSYFEKMPIIVLPNHPETKEKLHALEREYKILFERRSKEIICLPPEKLISFSEEYEILASGNGIQFSNLPPGSEEDLVSTIKEVDSFRGKIRDVREKIIELRELENSNILITSSFSAQTSRLSGLFQEENIKQIQGDIDEIAPFEQPLKGPTLSLVLSEIRNGFIIPEYNLHVWTDNDIFGRDYKKKSRFKRKSSKAIESFIDLKEGDHVVHVNHGIGKFTSIEKVLADGKTRDFIKLTYSGGDTLFVPLDQISLVQRFVGGSENPPLDSLGKSQWKKKLDRAKGAVGRLAEELLVMYANRMKLQGYSFPQDTIWQEEFEAEFEYEETPDQLSAIEAVKSDLESHRPMDRLVCGDVGYGKTEIAIRAAFKVIMAGKQVMLITPTTILTLQHYNNLKERYKNYPIKLDMVSRFKTTKEIKESILKFSKGELDLLVGTHSLLSASLKPKNLGLLIIDEEQRFGVNQKDTIKKYKNLVDVLTLSATPIPRTLHMSLTGIRDLSIIETPPKNRQSVETYVLEESDEIIISAIRKELERDGQIFYLHNRVETIESEAHYLGKLLPDISIGILHGQLSEEDVEMTLMDFFHKKYDVLITTTIIESGIDMPNVNTILVKRADTFGLSQLYQIRGRVGRSGRKAFAYLFYPADRALSETAEKRLNTIYEYQELGSGFKVAMRDLEIRGAGNLLGKEQSGNIMDIGFDLYVQLLNEAVSKLKNENIEIETRAFINLSANFYIPESYIPDSKQKIEFYKRFEGASSLEEIDDLSKEMQDRFGYFPPEVNTFILLEKVRAFSSQMGFESVVEDNGDIKLKSGSVFKGDPSKIISLLSKKESRLYILPNEPAILRFKPFPSSEEEKIRSLLDLLKKIAGK
jgi:transcription-repair coupling factor (superfamily II helicase)